jgi:hypothetical protein
MYWDIVEMVPKGDYCLFVRFQDGLKGLVRLRREQLTGTLEPLRDERFFERVFINDGQSLGQEKSIWRRIRCTPKYRANKRTEYSIGRGWFAVRSLS